jgi:eukaryotic-like serine/threonine-protein kinase
MSMVELSPGDVFASFRVVQKLSAGGMGAVYVVVQESTGRRRALKLMHPDTVGNAALRGKFIQEARIGARVESEHVIDVVDAGVDGETSVPWLAMELLEGEDLSALIARRGALAPAEAAAIMEQLCHAIGAAHAAGIVHRDLKPDNLFLATARRTDGTFTLKVLDFGIAKLVEEARTSANTGALGTPFWMAPEQTDRRGQITTATDVWALGLIAYRLLTGRPFWHAANDRDGSLPVFMRELIVDPIPRASERAREQAVAHTLPPGFDAWFARCVAREQSGRFRDARVAHEAFAVMMGIRPSFDPSAALPAATVVVHTGSHAAPAPLSTSLGSARTLADPNSLSPDDAHDDLLVLPKRGGGKVWPLGAAGIVALGGIAFVLLRERGEEPRVVTLSGPVAVIEPARRCPKTMVPIGGGSFSMGADDGTVDQKPVHSVTVKPFCLDMTEVLVSEYAECVAKKGCVAAATKVSWPSITGEDEARWSPVCNGGRSDVDDHPANCVSWAEADRYCKWAQKRLPTETEWEYAARGPESRVYPWGNEPPDKDRLNGCGDECVHGAHFRDPEGIPLFAGQDGWETTAPTRSFDRGKTPEGVFDLAGNVREWTASAYCRYGEEGCASKWRVTRGGAWTSDAREGVKAATRDKSAPEVRSSDIGFRCAL